MKSKIMATKMHKLVLFVALAHFAVLDSTFGQSSIEIEQANAIPKVINPRCTILVLTSLNSARIGNMTPDFSGSNTSNNAIHF